MRDRDDARKDGSAILVVLASDLTVLREGMKRLLQPQDDIRVIGEIRHALEVLSSPRLLGADVLVIVTHPAETGETSFLTRIREAKPSLKLLVITRAPSPRQILGLLREGARGLLDAACAPSQLAAAVRAVSAGRLYIHDEVRRLMTSDVGEVGKDFTHRSLTQRELEIFKQLAAGHKVSEIANQLGISVKTVSTHKARLMEKMGIVSHSQLIQYAVANSLFRPVHSDQA